MRVTIEERCQGVQLLGAFAEAHGLEIVVRLRPLDAIARGLPTYIAEFPSCETKDHPGSKILCSSYGDGRTIEDAIAGYARAISGRILVVNSGRPNRREIPVPLLVAGLGEDAL